MAKRKAISDWLNNDQVQLRWAYDYLRKRRKDNEANLLCQRYEQVLQSLEALAGDAAGRKLMDDMREAWNRLSSNRKSGKSTCSYSLTKTADRRLASLAKRFESTKSATLEALIERGFEFENEERKVRRDALAEERAAWKKRKPLNFGPTLSERIAHKQIEELRRQIDARQSLFEGLLLLFAQREVLLEANPTIKRALTTEQLFRVNERHAALLDQQASRLKVALDFAGVADVFPELSEIPVATQESDVADSYTVPPIADTATQTPATDEGLPATESGVDVPAPDVTPENGELPAAHEIAPDNAEPQAAVETPDRQPSGSGLITVQPKRHGVVMATLKPHPHVVRLRSYPKPVVAAPRGTTPRPTGTERVPKSQNPDDKGPGLQDDGDN